MLKGFFNAEYAKYAEGTEYSRDAAGLVALYHFQGVEWRMVAAGELNGCDPCSQAAAWEFLFPCYSFPGVAGGSG